MPPAAVGGGISVPAASGTRHTSPDMIVSNGNEAKKSKKKTNSISNPDDASSGNSILVAANENKQTVPEMMLSNENQTKKSRKGKTSKKTNSISDPGDPSLGNNIPVMGIETRQNVSEILSNEKDTKKPKKRKTPKKTTSSVSNSGDASSGDNILVVANETKRTAPEMMLSNENQTKTSRTEANAISNPGDASSGDNFLVVADETKQNVPEMMLSDVNETKKSKKRKRSKTRMKSVPNDGDVSSGKKIQQVASETERTVLEMTPTHENKGDKSKKQKNSASNVGSISNVDEIPSGKKSSFGGHSSPSPDVYPYDRRDEKRDRNAQSVYSDGEADLKLSSPTASAQRKLLILDLNGLLAEIVPLAKKQKPDIRCGRTAVFRRPFCDDFLQFCLENFDVGVWTSRKSKTVQGLIHHLMGDKRKSLRFCWYQPFCTKTSFKTLDNEDKPIILKEFKKLSDENLGLPWKKGYYNASNTLLIDDSPYKALRNPPYTAIFPDPYSHKDVDKDDSLGPNGELRLYLKRLAAAEDVQEFVKNNPFGQQPITSSSPSWEFYSKVIDAPDPIDKKALKREFYIKKYNALDPIEKKTLRREQQTLRRERKRAKARNRKYRY